MKKLILLLISAALIVAGSMFLHSCEGMDFFNGKDEIDDTIVNSVELENFIMAAMAVEQARAAFTEELSSIDFSALKVTYDENGRRIKHLPENVTSLDMGEKMQVLNATRDEFLDKFPEFVSFRDNVSIRYFEKAVQNSTNLQYKFFEMDVNISQPRLRSLWEPICIQFHCDFAHLVFMRMTG